jgi:4-amino-4-deoxy-L-arabinose transferase-like glycosyltransferase
VLFLATLCFVTLTWRAGVFITDNFTLVRGLESLSHGRVWLDTAGPDSFVAPGTNVRDGYVYGRNYGQLVISLPALWALQAVDSVVNLHVALVAGWHLLALALVVQASKLTDYTRPLLYGGTGLVVASFLANAALVRTFTDASLALLALQLTSAIAVGLIAVFCYRLLERRHGTGVGLFAGAAVVAATPVGFWATIPKRHVFSALLLVTVLYAFARSRDADAAPTVPGLGPVPVYRAGAYALVGLFTTIHAAEALFAFFALVVVDIPTAPSNDRRTLGMVAGAFALSLVPLLVTNSLVTGELLRPPRAMGERGLTAPAQENLTSGGGGGGGGSGTGSDGGGSRTIGGQIEEFIAGLGAGPVGVIVGQILQISTDSLAEFTNLETISRTYVSSSVDGISQGTQFVGINLSLLEAGPVLGAAVGAVVGSLTGGFARLRRSLDATDALTVLFGVGFVLVYNSRLPLNTQVTVRYLLVLYPLGIVLLARAAATRQLLETQRSPLLWSYGAGVALGSQLLLAYFVIGQYAVGEAARVHALLGFGLGVVAAITTVASVADRRVEPVAAVALGLAAAAGTVFLLLTGFVHFAFIGEYVLPVVGAVSDMLAAAT